MNIRLTNEFDLVLHFLFFHWTDCHTVTITDSNNPCGDFAGDQVLEWNGRLLQGATFKEVYNIILESKPEPQVELVVSRPIG